MNEPSTDNRLIEQLAATLREPPDDELARGLQAPIDAKLRERLFEIMQTSRAGAVIVPMPMPAAANAAGRRRVVAGVVLAAAAAAAIVWVGSKRLRPDPEDTPRVAVAVLPAYELETDAGLATQRTNSQPLEGELRYRSNNQFTWLMRPAENVAAPVSARLCASTASGEQVEIDVGPIATVDESGAIRLQGRVASLKLSPGHWTVAIAVGVPELLIEVDSVCRASTSAGVVVQRFGMELLGD
jgi:hypothetical protein